MTIAYDRVGDGPPLVLMHPLGGDRHVWDPMLAALGASYDVIALDLPGFGKSPPLTGLTPTPRALAAAVAAMLAEQGVARPHVAGISLGGWVALELGLARTAGRVTAIAPAGLWAAPLVPKQSLAHRLARAFEPLIGLIASTKRGRRLLLSGSVADPDRIPARDAVHLVRAYGRAPGFVAVNDAMRAGMFADLDRVPCPVTLVWPDHDRLVQRPRSLPAHVRSVVLADAGHVPTWDAPDELARLIADSVHDADGSVATVHVSAGARDGRLTDRLVRTPDWHPGSRVPRLSAMDEQPRDDIRDQAAEEAAEHAERANEEREEMTRKATLADDADDAGESDRLERESDAHKDAAHDREDAAAERADDGD